MAVRVVLFSVFVILSIIGSDAAGELTILHSPHSLQFTKDVRTPESLLKEIFSASLGLSVEESSEWDGLAIIDPFSTPEAAVEIYIDGISSLSNSDHTFRSKLPTLPLTVDEYEPDTYEALKHRIQQRFNRGGSKLVNINLSDPDELLSYPNVFGEIAVPKPAKRSLQHLKPALEEDVQFLTELDALKAITAKVRSDVISADNVIDFYNFRFRSLHALADFHGPNSLQTKEAKKLLGEALQDLTDAFVKAYEGSVLVMSVATDVAHTRRTIRSVAANEVTERQSGNVGASADSYDSDYAAIFNIILWFGIVFSFALVAIVYTIMDMDPGRDSIIYRMTSTRMKKE